MNPNNKFKAMNLTTEDYIYIEAIGLILYYRDIPRKAQPKYDDLLDAAVNVAFGKREEEVSSALLKELVAQEAVAFKISNGDLIKPECNMGSIFGIVYKYTGESSVGVVINQYEDEGTPSLFNIQLSKLVEIFTR